MSSPPKYVPYTEIVHKSQIRACPFCGAKPKVWQWGMYRHTVIECSNYDVDTHRVYMQGDNPEEVIEAWNRRYEA